MELIHEVELFTVCVRSRVLQVKSLHVKSVECVRIQVSVRILANLIEEDNEQAMNNVKDIDAYVACQVYGSQQFCTSVFWHN